MRLRCGNGSGDWSRGGHNNLVDNWSRYWFWLGRKRDRGELLFNNLTEVRLTNCDLNGDLETC